MTNNGQELINLMLGLMMDSSKTMPNEVFNYYIETKKQPEAKPFYNLVAESFLTLYSFCNLMFERAWSQAFALLRVGLEQVAKVFVIANIDDALDEFININKEKVAYYTLKSEEDRRSFLKRLGIKRNNRNAYFDYGWIKKYSNDNEFGIKQLLAVARLEEFYVDIENTLNAFAHGTISIFQMNQDKWDAMRRYGKRSSLICCKLYDFLCCSWAKIIGKEQFDKTDLAKAFLSFKPIYMTFLNDEGE